MIHDQNCLVMDIDGTLCEIKRDGQTYADVKPIAAMVERLHEYHQRGFHIILFTSRNMQTYGANLGMIMANTAPVVIEWLARHRIPYDELHFGKPWPGRGGFYVDDRAIRPSEFLSLSYEEIQELLSREQTVASS